MYLITSESVTEGHPDKLFDYISDSILYECLKQDPNSRVAVNTFASANKITIAGQITTKAKINIEQITREAIKKIGYNNAKTDIDYKTCIIDINITEQSPDIAMRNKRKCRRSRRPRNNVWVCNRRNTRIYAIWSNAST